MIIGRHEAIREFCSNPNHNHHLPPRSNSCNQAAIADSFIFFRFAILLLIIASGLLAVTKKVYLEEKTQTEKRK